MSQKSRMFEDKLRMTESRSTMYSDEISKLRTTNMEKEKRANELNAQASQFTSTKMRLDNLTKELENLRNK